VWLTRDRDLKRERERRREKEREIYIRKERERERKRKLRIFSRKISVNIFSPAHESERGISEYGEGEGPHYGG
jgi:hypothetical protein